MKFRKDINGLRAIGLIAVICFHFNNNLFPGGVAALDIFFVISGYLMSAIIFKGLTNDNFSFGEFYAARARRIVPSLFFICAFMLVFGWFYLIPLDYKLLGRHVASTMGFFSNFTYNNEAGYFDSLANTKWLLHTWSLSLEWQFYLLYPILLAFLYRFFSMRVLKHTILALAVIGYLYGIYATRQDADAAYFLLPSRAWDMMAGSLVFLYPLNLSAKTKKYAEWIGLALIFGCYTFIDIEVNVWPGPWVLIPVIGTVLVMYAQNNDSIITGNPIAQALGNWSYSVYLWHWPIVVGISYFALPHYWLYIGFVASFIIGYFGYHYIEMGNWKSSYHGIKRVLTFKPLYMMLALLILGRATYSTDGFITHYPQGVIIASNEANNKNPYRCLVEEKFPCYIGNQDNVQAIIVGDSHADSMTTALAEVFDLQTTGIIALTKPQCLFLLGTESMSIPTSKDCAQMNIQRVEFLQQNYPGVPIFWGASTAEYLYPAKQGAGITPADSEISLELLQEIKQNLPMTLAEVSDQHPIYLITQIPEMYYDVPREISKALMQGRTDIDLSTPQTVYQARTAPVTAMLESVAEEVGATVLYPEHYMCEAGRCLADDNFRPLFYDDDHLSEFGNRRLTPMFAEVLKSPQTLL